MGVNTQNNQPTTTDDSNSSSTGSAEIKDSESIYGSYSKEAVKARLSEMGEIVENGHIYLPAEVKEAESYLNGWKKNPELLRAMMESNLDPNNTQGIDGPIEDELTEEEFGELSVRARINARESQSAFNVPGSIEYMLEIQSTNDQPFTLQGLKVNRGKCGYYTGDFHSKMPVTMNYSSTVSYLLKCRGDQVLEAELNRTGFVGDFFI
ncbi:hypothetical protein ACT4VK_10530 [Acinetobacter baumannii]|uniref:hypothetical protein n=1 Tax=Acinetobacter baumannii TaxID=470 RepID=UPI00295892CC|nr:hypothetical protein [Acinetobacter baumannii]WNX67877.1 hypothetical protein RWA07_04725 [Acinetobacter baumannii]